AFVYNKPNNVTVFPALFSADGDTSPTPTLAQLAESNRQSLNLAPALLRLTSTDIRMIPGSGHALPSGINAWSRTAGGENHLTAILPITAPGGGASGSYNDIFIGYFAPLFADSSDDPFVTGDHFMLVNAATSGTAAGSAQWYHLTFDFGATGIDS